MSKGNQASHDPRVHSEFNLSSGKFAQIAHLEMLRDCSRPWLMLENMRMRMTPRTMRAVPRTSDVVTATIISTDSVVVTYEFQQATLQTEN